MTTHDEAKLNEGFREELRRSLAREEMAVEARATIPEGFEQRLFANLAGRKSRRLPPRSMWQLGALLAAGLAFLVFATRLATPEDDGMRLKGDAVVAAQLEALKLAVARDGKVTRALDGAEVPVGAAIVFEVESRGLDPERGAPVELSYAVDGGAFQTITTTHVLRRERETLAKEDGYLAFKPEIPGNYVFRARLRGDATVKDVRLHVAP